MFLKENHETSSVSSTRPPELPRLPGPRHTAPAPRAIGPSSRPTVGTFLLGGNSDGISLSPPNYRQWTTTCDCVVDNVC